MMDHAHNDMRHTAFFALCSQVQVFIEHPESWARVLGAAIPQTSNFFLNYVITRAFMMNFVRLLMPREYSRSVTAGFVVLSREV
jgi:hypothetical protein